MKFHLQIVANFFMEKFFHFFLTFVRCVKICYMKISYFFTLKVTQVLKTSALMMQRTNSLQKDISPYLKSSIVFV